MHGIELDRGYAVAAITGHLLGRGFFCASGTCPRHCCAGNICSVSIASSMGSGAFSAKIGRVTQTTRKRVVGVASSRPSTSGTRHWWRRWHAGATDTPARSIRDRRPAPRCKTTSSITWKRSSRFSATRVVSAPFPQTRTARGVIRAGLSSWHLDASQELSQSIAERWRISRPKVDLIVPDAEVLGQCQQPRDRGFGLAHLPFHDLLRRQA